MTLLDLLWSVIFYPILYVLPAYVANGAPVLFGAGRPIDRGKKFRGKPILGKNKTVRGLVAGIACGCIIAAVEFPFLNYMLAIGVLMSIGTQIGDLLGSFAKRQIGMGSGKSLPIADQYLFLVFAVLLAVPFGHFPSLYGWLFIIVFTGLLHLFTNIGAYKLKLKKVPW